MSKHLPCRNLGTKYDFDARGDVRAAIRAE